MDTSKLLLGTIAGGIVYWLLGGLFFIVLFGSYFTANAGSPEAIKEPVEMWAIVVGCLLYALFLTYVFLKWAGIKTLSSGAKAGAIIGLMLGLSFNFIRFGDSNFFGSVVPLLVDGVVLSVMSAGAGATIGWVLGRGE